MIATIALAAIAVTGATAASLKTSDSAGYINYTTITGSFLQDEPTTNASTFNYTLSNFGLIDRSYPATEGLTANLTQWQKFERQVDALNAAAPLNTVYKVLFMGRHGQGYHNAAESYYRTPAWNCYWAQLKGNATPHWEDAQLTSDGILQAQIAHNFWKHEIEVQKIPYPQSYYTSPLSRCLATANLTFAGLDLPVYYSFVPTVEELLREGISIHTCDHRSNRTYIEATYPDFEIEQGLNEYDELWNGVTAEPDSAHEKRMLTLLDGVFTNDDHTWISLTSHSGTIGTILDVIGHQSFSLATGSVIPVLVEAKFLPASDTPTTSVGSFTTSTWCHNAPPITSVGSEAQGCVCSSTIAPLPSLDTQAPFVPGQTAPINEYTTTTTVSASPSQTGCSSYAWVQPY
ncbi:putative phosphoglycerate mutase [Fulvia fulva]|uniref:Phosphoglycerate mutase n=1 Tax=Passalora fulva TaxID=5499 RepID=A0A9Q8LA37_PASFU|nr:putative phosphoglycerate mutase [Fulvia fulva]KAK4633966.1 putative phosphoglycerate mutase [Fulvia fulva]UJO13715.1 putative phosphoglycerate mutase [Fulvia fulva]WPV11581.1 putative phosphoglycerate mutase [Fulvia fulva]